MRFSRRRSAAERFGFLGWLALGAGVASLGLTLFDPTRGAARRAAIRDRATSAARTLGARTRDLGTRTRGRLLDTSSRMRGRMHEMRVRLQEGAVSDAVLEERIRLQIGRLVSHPGALRVSATRGSVEIIGPVLAKEAEELVERIRGMRGVKDVVERLEVHEEAGSEPSFQEIAGKRGHATGFAG